MNKIDGNGSINFLQGDVGQIEQTLPIELIKNILFFVDDRTLQSTATVCRRWSLASLSAGAEKRFGLLLPFAKFLRQHLNKETYDSNQIEQFKVIECDTTLFGSKNLVEVKSSFLALKEKFINILKDLEEGDLAALELLFRELPQVNKLCSLALLYKVIDEANADPDEVMKNILLSRTSKELAEAGQIEKAIDIAQTVAEDVMGRSYVLCQISEILTKEGQLDKAIEVAKIIGNEDNKWQALGAISNILTKEGQIDKAIELVKANPEDNLFRIPAIHDICTTLIQSGQFDKSIVMATTFLDELHAMMVFCEACTALTQRGEFDKAIEIANAIPQNKAREVTLKEISEAMEGKFQ